MKKTRKIVSVLLSLIMVIGIMSVAFVSVDAASSGITGQCSWTYDSSTKVLTISGNGAMGTYDKVDVFNSNSPFSNTYFSKIIIKNGVTSIGKCAFWRTSFDEIEIPSSVTSIKDYAFHYASLAKNGRTITIPNSVTSLGTGAFEGFSFLARIVIPNSIKVIPSYCFSHSSLNSVTFPSGLTEIGYYAFQGCNFTSISIPNGVTKIGNWAFDDNTKLRTVNIPASVTSIGAYAFGFYTYKSTRFMVDGCTIYGYKNSAAERYAKENNLFFESLGVAPSTPSTPSTPTVTVPSAAAPTNVTMYNHDTGLHVDWHKAANASRYIVYYRPSWSSSWSSTTTSNTYCNLTGLTPGTLYYVQVRSVNSAGVNGGISSATSFTHVRGTKLNSTAYNSNGTVTVGWSSAPGANGYAVAKKKSTDKSYTYYYVSGTSFNDKNIAGGALYYYQIRPYYSNGKSAAYAEWSNSKTITTLFKPTVTNMNATASRLNINWNAIKGATAYKVAFKRSTDSAWNFRTTTSRYYNVANPTQGATYQVQVCAINGSLAGAYSSVNTIKISSTPSSTTPSVNNTKPALTLSNKSNGIRVEWGAISGATSYVVYYKEVGYPDWSSVTTKNNYYPFLDAYVGESYFFQVLPMFGNTKGTFSSVYQLQFIPVTNNNLNTTYLTNVYSSPLGLGVELNWNRVNSADGYVISRYCENDKSYNYFTLSGDGPCSEIDPFVKDGNTYVYWIRVYVESNGSRTYGPWSLSKRITYSKS